MGMDVRGLKPKGKVADDRTDADDEWAEAGEYFRANIWAWPVILDLCANAIDTYGLRISMKGWQFNDGRGIKSPEKCEKLADALEAYIEDHPPDGDRFTLDLGWYCDETGKLTNDEAAGSQEGMSVAHRVTAVHVRRWITFLRNCGGFRIW
jgi:hypothetical protein